MGEPEPEPEPEPQPEAEADAEADAEAEAEAGGDAAEAAAGEADPFARVKKNSAGGVDVSDQEITLAFEFFDPGGKGSVDKASLQERLALFPGAAEHGLQELKGLDSGLTQKSLKKMLKGNKVTEFDPVAEAFKLLDPKGEGHVDMSVVRELFRGMGMGELTKDELNVIRRSGGNASGFITLEDFRTMLDAPAEGAPM